MKKNFYLFISIGLILLLPNCLTAKETVKIGLITPLTGDVKTFGESAKNAFTIALEDYAKVGKYQIVPVIADDKNDPTEGANGAGKTTLLKTITGILRPSGGTIEYQGKNIVKMRPDRIARLGICLVPEGRRVFPDLTVRENLELGGYAVVGRALKKDLFDLSLRTFPRLKERLRQAAGTLSGGEQQMLAVGRALMGNPNLLLLDEPSMGLSPIVTREIFTLIKKINQEKGMSMILVEQNANLALDFSHRAYVLETGRVVMEGESATVKRDPAVIDAYLGLNF